MVTRQFCESLGSPVGKRVTIDHVQVGEVCKKCLCQDVAFIYHPETKALRPWKQTKFGPGGRSIFKPESSWIKDGQTHVKG